MQAGTRIGAWELERKLGEGAMGEVWRAHRLDDPDLIVAFKSIKGEISGDVAKRFLREAAILADLDHPGVPAFHDYSTQPPFLVMEFVRGRSIHAVLREDGALSVPDSLEIVRQVVDAIAYLHGRGIWHRDIKPDNLILTPDGWVKLVDFGVARGDGYAELTAVGMVVGTMAYMPPEVFRGVEPDPVAWDLYAAGVLLHRLLTTRNGFETGLRGPPAQVEQTRLKLSTPSLDPGESVPRDVRDLIADMTRREPDERITSPGQAGRRLQQLLRAHPGADLVALGGGRTDVAGKSSEGGRIGIVIGVTVAVMALVCGLGVAVAAVLAVMGAVFAVWAGVRHSRDSTDPATVPSCSWIAAR